MRLRSFEKGKMYLVTACVNNTSTLPRETYYEPYNVPNPEIVLRRVNAIHLQIINRSVVAIEQFLWEV